MARRRHVLMTGPVATSFIGEIDLAAYSAVMTASELAPSAGARP